jgi:hypothetical protein
MKRHGKMGWEEAGKDEVGRGRKGTWDTIWIGLTYTSCIGCAYGARPEWQAQSRRASEDILRTWLFGGRSHHRL